MFALEQTFPFVFAFHSEAGEVKGLQCGETPVPVLVGVVPGKRGDEVPGETRFVRLVSARRREQHPPRTGKGRNEGPGGASEVRDGHRPCPGALQHFPEALRRKIGPGKLEARIRTPAPVPDQDQHESGATGV